MVTEPMVTYSRCIGTTRSNNDPIRRCLRANRVRRKRDLRRTQSHRAVRSGRGLTCSTGAAARRPRSSETGFRRCLANSRAFASRVSGHRFGESPSLESASLTLNSNSSQVTDAVEFRARSMTGSMSLAPSWAESSGSSSMGNTTTRPS